MRLGDWMAENPRKSQLVSIWLTGASVVTSLAAILLALWSMSR